MTCYNAPPKDPRAEIAAHIAAGTPSDGPMMNSVRLGRIERMARVDERTGFSKPTPWLLTEDVLDLCAEIRLAWEEGRRLKNLLAAREARAKGSIRHKPGCDVDVRGCMPDCENYDPRFDG